MRLSGVDPGIIRELSGIYKPFVKAFKELISNAYDADASSIRVTVSDDFSTVEVLDDGIGMTPYSFHDSFARLGGSTAWLHGGKSPGGRQRIGYKGIGFLAVARYCGALHVETKATRPHRSKRRLQRRNRISVPLDEVVGSLVPAHLVAGRITIRYITAVTADKSVKLTPDSDYSADKTRVRLLSPRARSAKLLEIDYEVDCRGLVLEAELDFDYLLSLEKQADLRSLDDFCTTHFRAADAASPSYTRVQLRRLREFVVRDLSAPRVKGKARNIAFKSGKEQFFWRLQRTSPIRDDVAPPEAKTHKALQRVVGLQAASDLPTLSITWRSEPPLEVARPVYVRENLEDGAVIPIEISEGGLEVVGYLLPCKHIIYPAELRGISVRVRNVAIGDASFLGWEHLLSGPRKAALSQISGELIVLKGMDASDAINPGRESFYEESAHYRILRRVLFGSEESVGGVVGLAVRDILDRIHVRSQATDKLSEAKVRRRTLTDVSSAVNFYSRESGSTSKALRTFFDSRSNVDGLATAREVVTRPAFKIAGFEVVNRKGLSSDVEIDFVAKQVAFDFAQDPWSTTVYMNGHYYEVSLRQGKPDQPICEFDNQRRCIYVNWGHPVKTHMDDATFLKSAILLRLAHYAAPKDANAMMTLALNMIAFRAE